MTCHDGIDIIEALLRVAVIFGMLCEVGMLYEVMLVSGRVRDSLNVVLSCGSSME